MKYLKMSFEIFLDLKNHDIFITVLVRFFGAFVIYNKI